MKSIFDHKDPVKEYGERIIKALEIMIESAKNPHRKQFLKRKLESMKRKLESMKRGTPLPFLDINK